SHYGLTNLGISRYLANRLPYFTCSSGEGVAATSPPYPTGEVAILPCYPAVKDGVPGTAAPVYLADGTLVTTSKTSSRMWSGGLGGLRAPINEDLSGTVQPQEFVWTGTGGTGL